MEGSGERGNEYSSSINGGLLASQDGPRLTELGDANYVFIFNALLPVYFKGNSLTASEFTSYKNILNEEAAEVINFFAWYFLPCGVFS
jgi:hypothetical protein